MDTGKAWDCLEAMKEQFDYLEDEALTEEELLFFGMTSAFVPPEDSFIASPAA